MQSSPKWKRYMHDLDSLTSPYLLTEDPVSLAREYLNETFQNPKLYEEDTPYVYEDINFFKGKRGSN